MVILKELKMKCPKTQAKVNADNCEDCVSERRCYEWCSEHIVWGATAEPIFIHEIGKYGEGLGEFLSPPKPQGPYKKEATTLSLR
ncbi:MAG TPA: hypothetical protein VMV84_03195, partial [Dehalococcoidales bacterium]|nr:hypothetical protein [Dehalococcoidales bacterium]